MSFEQNRFAHSSQLASRSSLRQNHRTIFCHRNAMLKVRAEASICGHCRPLVTQHSRLGLAVIDHRLDRDHHTFAQLGAVTSRSEVRDLRLDRKSVV